MTPIRIRPLREDDAPAAARIFFDAVRRGTAEHYTAEQRRAWAGEAPDPDGWRERLRRMTGFAAERDGAPVGFMTIDADGLIDLAFVAPDAAGQGVGGALLKRVEAAARALGPRRLHTEASLRARPFFERHGFRVVEERTVVKRGIELRNVRMERAL